MVLQVGLWFIPGTPCVFQSWLGRDTQYRSTAVPQYRSCLEIPHYSWCPDCMGEGQLFQPLIPSFLAGGGLLENIQLLTIQLMYTLAGNCE